MKGITSKNFARPELDKRRLGEVVDLFTNIQMIEHGSSKDILGALMNTACPNLRSKRVNWLGSSTLRPA